MTDSCPVNTADSSEMTDPEEVKRDSSGEEETQRSCLSGRQHLQVYLRIRPLTSAERTAGESQDCVTIQPPDTVLLKPPRSERPAAYTGQHLQFSQVYGPETTQSQLFDGTVRDLLKDFLEGGNSLLFTYGVTNAGKTFTFLGPDSDPGLLPRSLDLVFGSIGEQIFGGSSIKPQRCREFVRLSREEQAEEAAFKRSLLRQSKEAEKSSATLLDGTNRTLSEASTLGRSEAEENKISLTVETNTKFSVWVSFCEIYKENIHDLLDVAPGGSLKRAALRLSQDAAGNAFVKDLRWVQVNTAEEAYGVLKLGKKNQSFSSTRLNHVSSRSHSIFSIRLLRIEDVGAPRVQAVSELCLCDLAGSERCAKTQNKGERLKEAGNINTSLLILGKCINALRHNQQARMLQHVPFRESKLTHYLQGFLCGRGKACMIVNINQCASMYDETLNVLKFSAVAQKIVVLPSRPVRHRTASGDTSFVLAAERKAPQSSRRSSLIGCESSLEDVQEEDEDEDMSLMDQTGNDEDDDDVTERKKQKVALDQLHLQLKKERAKNLMLEAQIREEVSREFTQLFSDMQSYYEERLAREGQILEQRAERRLELFKNLVDKMSVSDAEQDANAMDGELDRQASDPAEKDSLKAQACPCSGRAAPQIKMKTPELHDEQQEDDEEDDDEEKRKLALELQEKSSADARQEKQLKHELQEALVALETERRRAEDALAALEDQTQGREEALASLLVEKTAKEEAIVAMEELRRQKEETLALLVQERREKEAALEQERRARQEAGEALEQERRARQEAGEALEQERRARQEAGEALEQEKNSREELDEEKEEVCMLQKRQSDEIRELKDKLEAAENQVMKMRSTEQSEQLEEPAQQILVSSPQISCLKPELPAAMGSSGGEQLRGKTLQDHVMDLESELEKVKQQSAHKQLVSEQQLKELTEKLNEAETAAEQRADELGKKLLQLEEASHQKLQEQDALSHQRLKELKQKLRYQEETSRKASSEAEDVRRRNSELQAELASLKEKLSSVAAAEDTSGATPPAETEAQDRLMETLTELQKASQQTEAELQRKLLDLESQVTSLQKSLKEAQERREEEEAQAVQEARRREVERRRELLAVAHQAIAQKDEELEKKTQEISRLKENSKQDAEKLKNLELDLLRKEEDASDLRDKLADYKKQIQQVQKEISAMREEEKVLRQKLSDMEKSKKQLQSDVSSRDRTIQQLKVEQTSSKLNDTLQLYQQACRDLEAKERVMEDMRLALTEQEETQEQMEQVLDQKLGLIQELSSEVEKLKAMLLQERGDPSASDGSSDQLRRARKDTSQAQEDLKALTEKHQAERRKWLEDKLLLIGQAKEAEDKRNQEMKKFAEDRERSSRQQSLLESQLLEKDQTMERWRTERDALVAALEVQLQKLLSSQAEKEKVIQQLRLQNTQPPQEVDSGPGVADLQDALDQKDAEILHLKDQLNASVANQKTVSQPENKGSPAGNHTEGGGKTEADRRETRASVRSQGSAGFPSVLDSSEISTENGRTSRFPRPELEISFSPLQPNRMALRRQGDDTAVTVKITRSARKRKSSEMEKEDMEAENRRNTKTKVTPKLTPHKEETASPAGCHDSPNSIRSRKEGALLKIGDFLQSSPTLFSSKAKKMMNLVSGRSEADSAASSSSLSLRGRRNKKKLYRPEISSPMDMPAHPMISREAEEDGDHQTVKRRLRSRVAK